MYPAGDVVFWFEDVQNEKAFYYDAVYWAYRAETPITKGTDATHFSPNDACTRAQVVTFLWRAAGYPEPGSGATAFTDLKPGAFYEKAVAWAVEQGITKGMSPTSFAPDATCTRGQIVTFLWRFKGMPAPVNDKSQFTDVIADSYCRDAVQWASESEVTRGVTNTTFGPDSICSRGQVVTFLYRAIEIE